jgi:hypothetical protein
VNAEFVFAFFLHPYGIFSLTAWAKRAEAAAASRVRRKPVCIYKIVTFVRLGTFNDRLFCGTARRASDCEQRACVYTAMLQYCNVTLHPID